MRILFSDHAEIKLRHRKIRREAVINALLNPDFVRPSYGGREIAYKVLGRNYLTVIFRREDTTLVVITQHWVARIKKKD